MLVSKWQGLVPYLDTRMHVCRFAYSTHCFGASSQVRRFSSGPKMLRRWTGFETYCRNLHFDVHVPFRGFTLVRCKPGAAYQGLVPESMLVFKCQGLVPYFVTRMHVCRFSYSTHRFGSIESGPSFFEGFKPLQKWTSWPTYCRNLQKSAL